MSKRVFIDFFWFLLYRMEEDRVYQQRISNKKLSKMMVEFDSRATLELES